MIRIDNMISCHVVLDCRFLIYFICLSVFDCIIFSCIIAMNWLNIKCMFTMTQGLSWFASGIAGTTVVLDLKADYRVSKLAEGTEQQQMYKFFPRKTKHTFKFNDLWKVGGSRNLQFIPTLCSFLWIFVFLADLYCPPETPGECEGGEPRPQGAVSGHGGSGPISALFSCLCLISRWLSSSLFCLSHRGKTSPVESQNVGRMLWGLPCAPTKCRVSNLPEIHETHWWKNILQ